jgi:hypothetical protein
MKLAGKFKGLRDVLNATGSAWLLNNSCAIMNYKVFDAQERLQPVSYKRAHEALASTRVSAPQRHAPHHSLQRHMSRRNAL